MSARSFDGEMSISSARSSARVRWVIGGPPLGWTRRPSVGRPRRLRGSGIDVVHQLVHEGRDEANRPDRLGIRHAGRSEDADDADRPAGLAVWREDERYVAHLLGTVLGADENLDRARARDLIEELAEVRPALEGREDAAKLLAPLELGRFHDVQEAVAEHFLDDRRVVVANRGEDALADAADERLDRAVAVDA